METQQTGALIAALRRERHMTQHQVAERLGVSDQAVSKWERGLGMPDVSLLGGLAGLFEISVERLLSGTLDPNDIDGGNMKRLQFYVCPDCGNLLTATGGAEVSCCGRKLTALTPQPVDAEHDVTVETVEEDYYLTFSHPMEKNHFFRFAAYLSYDRVLLVRLYPEQGGEVRIPQLRGGRLLLCCSRDGLFEKKL